MRKRLFVVRLSARVIMTRQFCHPEVDLALDIDERLEGQSTSPILIRPWTLIVLCSNGSNSYVRLRWTCVDPRRVM